jgi:hypothetical protein
MKPTRQASVTGIRLQNIKGVSLRAPPASTPQIDVTKPGQDYWSWSAKVQAILAICGALSAIGPSAMVGPESSVPPEVHVHAMSILVLATTGGTLLLAQRYQQQFDAHGFWYNIKERCTRVDPTTVDIAKEAIWTT